MKQYTDAELQSNYDTFMTALGRVFNGERLEKLNLMYSEEELGGNLILSPASGNINYHNAYPGGYIDHVMNVVRNSMKIKALYQEQGGFIDFTDEELLFSAFHHDLGKLGTKGIMEYVPQTNDWYIKNRGANYERNKKLSWLDHNDRTTFLLNQYGIKYTENEFMGMKLTDGMYEKTNEKYYMVYDTDKYLRSNIQYILHWADHMSTCIERDFIKQAPF